MASIDDFKFLRAWIKKQMKEAESIKYFLVRENCISAWTKICEQIDFLALYIYGFDFEEEKENE